MRVLAPAKINLHLRVGPPRADGCHPLCSWMCSVGLFDTLEFQHQRAADANNTNQGNFVLSCTHAALAIDRSNLVVRAAESLLAEFRSRWKMEGAAKVGGIAASLDKQIPTGAGLGGGSSDAGRTLLALNSFLKLGLPREELERIGGSLGSDVPFFFHLPSAVCTGRGEVVRAISAPKPWWCLLIFPEYGISTPAVYKRFDQMQLGSQLTPEPDWQRWTQLASLQLLPLLVNDLEEPAFAIRPELGEMRLRIERKLGRIVRMSGSGSSLFTLFDTDEELRGKEAQETVARAFPGTRAICVQLAPNFEDDLHDNRSPGTGELVS